ncbi:MAG: alpha-1,6-mannanase [Pseudopedobacter saltans]|uniref:Alpha-1,6-mannanase n=1 Tax=Pseudopedobacter saltans TaxID=151895 RepID=A0A2W5F0H3_9SPHI|nr:MAG: alpha-1,6-mannanase [Pseudopedobacter saltans]
MKLIYFMTCAAVAVVSLACTKHEGINAVDNVGKTISPVNTLSAVSTTNDSVVLVSWTNPVDEALLSVELSFKPVNTTNSFVANPIVKNVKSGTKDSTLLRIGNPGDYRIALVAINKAGIKSDSTIVQVNSQSDSIPILLKRADTLMSSLVKLYLDGKARDIWNTSYPSATGPYWDGAAVVWGQGGIFSGYAALKIASEKFSSYKQKVASLYDIRLFNALEKFVTTRGQRPTNTISAYAVYPDNGNERFYDDNVWIGIDMADLYILTKDSKYLDRAKMVWDFIKSGTDTVLGGGVYWKENDSAKMTCSNAPSVVLAAKLYQITNDANYLASAKSIYQWVKSHLQDPSDYLYWDNMSYGANRVVNIGKTKYTYNSGQPIEAAALLYNITKEQQYLTDAQNVAGSIFKQWGIPFNSYLTGQSFTTIDPAGHVWFRAVMLRGLIELYKIDHNRLYVDSYENLINNAWLSDCRNKQTNLLNTDFRGGTTQSSWEILFQGAALEMMARLAELRAEGL